MRHVVLTLIFLCACGSPRLDSAGQRVAGVYNPPVATLSYVPAAAFHTSKADRLDGPFNFSWDSKLLFDSAQGPCLAGTGTCEELIAFGAHPEAIAVSDYTDLNGLEVSKLGSAGGPSLVVLEGGQEFANDGSC